MSSGSEYVHPQTLVDKKYQFVEKINDALMGWVVRCKKEEMYAINRPRPPMYRGGPLRLSACRICC